MFIHVNVRERVKASKEEVENKDIWNASPFTHTHEASPLSLSHLFHLLCHQYTRITFKSLPTPHKIVLEYNLFSLFFIFIFCWFSILFTGIQTQTHYSCSQHNDLWCCKLNSIRIKYKSKLILSSCIWKHVQIINKKTKLSSKTETLSVLSTHPT